MAGTEDLLPMLEMSGGMEDRIEAMRPVSGERNSKLRGIGLPFEGAFIWIARRHILPLDLVPWRGHLQN